MLSSSIFISFPIVLPSTFIKPLYASSVLLFFFAVTIFYDCVPFQLTVAFRIVSVFTSAFSIPQPSISSFSAPPQLFSAIPISSLSSVFLLLHFQMPSVLLFFSHLSIPCILKLIIFSFNLIFSLSYICSCVIGFAPLCRS